MKSAVNIAPFTNSSCFQISGKKRISHNWIFQNIQLYDIQPVHFLFRAPALLYKKPATRSLSAYDGIKITWSNGISVQVIFVRLLK